MGESIGLSPALGEYLRTYNRPEHPAQTKCRIETASELSDRAIMQISPEQGAVLSFLARMIWAKSAIEIGVFTGYSALSVALALQDMHGHNARLVACDLEKDYLDKAQSYWSEAGVDDVIETRIGPANASLDALLAEEGEGRFDFAFIDADKIGYDGYYERCLRLLRPGGLMLFDNVLWYGSVADKSKSDDSVRALRAISQKAREDMRVDMALTAIGDGLLCCLKR